jgi:hypothetical protein
VPLVILKATNFQFRLVESFFESFFSESTTSFCNNGLSKIVNHNLDAQQDGFTSA